MLNLLINHIQYKRNIKKAITTCESIYQNTQSFHLAQKGREEEKLHSYEFIYGEMNYHSLAYLLKRCAIQPNSVFYDLGSGAGKSLVFASLLYDFKKAIGIEKLKLLHACSLDAKNRSKISCLDFHCADLLSYEWQDADILLINAATFIGDFWTGILNKLYQLKSGTKIILVSRILPDDNFELLYQDLLPMSWGMARVSIYVVH